MYICIEKAGISVGSVYGLIAIGLNLTFWTTRTMNFGQGSVMMLCAILTATLVAVGWASALAALAALAVIVVLMVFTETYTVRPALKIEGSMGWAVSTLGVGIVLQGVAALWFKAAGKSGWEPSEAVYGGMFAVTAGILASVALQLFAESLDLTHSKHLCMIGAFAGMSILGISSALTA